MHDADGKRRAPRGLAFTDPAQMTADLGKAFGPWFAPASCY